MTAIRNGDDSGVSGAVQKDGRFQLTGLAPGQYAIIAIQPGQRQAQGLYGEQLVDISQSDVRNVQVLFQQPQSIPVHIQVVSTKEGQAATAMAQVHNQPGPPPNGQPRFPLGNITLQPSRWNAVYRGFAQLNPNAERADEPLSLDVNLPGTIAWRCSLSSLTTSNRFDRETWTCSTSR